MSSVSFPLVSQLQAKLSFLSSRVFSALAFAQDTVMIGAASVSVFLARVSRFFSSSASRPDLTSLPLLPLSRISPEHHAAQKLRTSSREPPTSVDRFVSLPLFSLLPPSSLPLCANSTTSPFLSAGRQTTRRRSRLPNPVLPIPSPSHLLHRRKRFRRNLGCSESSWESAGEAEEGTSRTCGSVRIGQPVEWDFRFVG